MLNAAILSPKVLRHQELSGTFQGQQASGDDGAHLDSRSEVFGHLRNVGHGVNGALESLVKLWATGSGQGGGGGKMTFVMITKENVVENEN